VEYPYVNHGLCYTITDGTTSSSPNPLSIYVTGRSSKGIVLVPDIWGLSYSQVFYVADNFATLGFSVAVVDIYRMNTWPYGTPPGPGIADFIGKMDPAQIQNDIQTAVALLKSDYGATSVGVLGFCFGAHAAFVAGQNTDNISAVAGAHPYFLENGTGMGAALKVPCAIISTPDDDAKAVTDEVLAGPFAAQSVFEVYEDQCHGFMAARGNFNDADVLSSVLKACRAFADFFNNVL